MEIHCIRHGVTFHNQENRFNGWLDESITEKQEAQLKEIDFSTEGYDAIYCSPLKRCTETAVALGIRDWIVEPRLKERGLGIFEGKTFSECELNHSEEFSRFRALDPHFVIPEGESRQQNLDRVLDWLNEIKKHEHVLAITHGGPIDFLYRMASNLPMHGGVTIFSGKNAHHSVFTSDGNDLSMIHFDRKLTSC